MQMSEFKRRRKRLMRDIGKGGIAIIPTAETQRRNNDVDHPYRPDSDFLYLTGFTEPDAVAVLRPGNKDGKFTLFCRERDPEKELWDGLRAGNDGARERFGADEAFPISQLDEILPGMLIGSERVFYAIGSHEKLDHQVPEWISRVRRQARSGIRGPQEIVALEPYLHEMRLYKSKAEIKTMRKSAQIAAEGHKRMMRACSPGLFEYQLDAEFQHACTMAGARQLAYSTIVGGGNNGCILHYVENDQKLNDGDLVLIDAGCEYEWYASDITRTFPVNGRFSPEQKTLYELVLQAQYAAIDKVRPGNHWNAPHDAAVEVLTKGLIELGLLKGKLANQIRKEGYKRYYMHRTGHWLGMDVHDVGEYKREDDWRTLEPGMTLTVEPGLYIPHGCKGVAKKWQGIGIRIEDDVLVTEEGHEVLSQDAPKTVDDIEALMKA